MSNELGHQNKTILGIHDKAKNIVMLVKNKTPIITESNQEPFLVTRDHQFIIDNNEILLTFKKLEYTNRFNSFKRTVANILIIPGLVISIAYALKLFGLFSQLALIEEIISDAIANQFFWIAIFGVILLWHDYYKSDFQTKKLPEITPIPENEFKNIETNGFKFGRYSIHNTISHLSIHSVTFLTPFIKSDSLKFSLIIKDLLSDEIVTEVLDRAGISEIKKDLIDIVQKDKDDKYPIHGLSSLFIYALQEALNTKSRFIEPVHFLLAITNISKAYTKYIETQNTSLNVLREACKYTLHQEYRDKDANYFNIDQQYYPTGGIAANWIYGYTYILNHFSKDINEQVTKGRDIFGIGHEKEVDALISILGKVSKKHALLIGEPGVGKSSLVQGLAQRINWGNVPPQLAQKRIIQLDLNGLISFSSQSNDMETNIKKAMEELGKAGNTILYIDEMQELIPSKAEESNHSLAGILLPYVLESRFPIIGTVNYADYKKYFYTNESFRQSFSNIEVSELSVVDTLEILESKVEVLEDNFDLYITTPALIASAELAQRYVTERMLPDSAVDTIESACSWAQANSIKRLTEEHIAKSLSIKTNININELDTEESNKLLQLDKKIKERVVGQDDAVNTVVDALKRSRTGINSSDKPIGVFLFIGPTGVGKTHLAKVVAEEFFGSKTDIVRIDMSEYQNDDSSTKLLGSQKENSTSQTEITLLDKVKVNPYTVILFDEIEKAHPNVLDLFLQLFDEGRLTSSLGETIDFTNTIIICTSNIGSSILMESLESGALWEDTKNRVIIELKQLIKPELFNRFDGIVTFSPHSIDNLAKITTILLTDLASRLTKQKLNLLWKDTIPMLIANKAFDPAFGARPIKRYIQEKIEGKIASDILEKNIQRGDNVTIEESWII